MKLRDVYLVNGESLSDSQTFTYNIARGLKILSLRVQYTATNGATSNTVGRLNGMVSKLQVLDGSNVLHSLSMREEQARNFAMYKRMPYQLLTQNGGDNVTEEAVIDFRRFEGDTNFYLDTATLANPQLSFTHDFTISATAGFATGTGTLTVIARVIDSGAPSRLGFVMAKELDSFSSTSSGDHTTDLPLDYPISEIMVLDPVDANTPDTYLSNFKLTADTDSFIPVDESYGDLLKANIEELGHARQKMAQSATETTQALDFDLYDDGSAVFGAVSDSTGTYIKTVVGNEVTPTSTAGTTGTREVELVGAAPHGAVYYKFGDGMTADQIFSPQGVGKFQLKLTNAATGATPKVVTIQQHG